MSNGQWLLMVFLMLAAMPANAQYTGAIKGRVADPQGPLVAGATLTLTGSDLQELSKRIEMLKNFHLQPRDRNGAQDSHYEKR